MDPMYSEMAARQTLLQAKSTGPQVKFDYDSDEDTEGGEGALVDRGFCCISDVSDLWKELCLIAIYLQHSQVSSDSCKGGVGFI